MPVTWLPAASSPSTTTTRITAGAPLSFPPASASTPIRTTPASAVRSRPIRKRLTAPGLPGAGLQDAEVRVGRAGAVGGREVLGAGREHEHGVELDAERDEAARRRDGRRDLQRAVR